MQKKTLVLKLSYDVSGSNDAQIEYLKSYMLAGIPPENQKQASFEVIVEDEEEVERRMIERVQQEFRKQDGRKRGMR